MNRTTRIQIMELVWPIIAVGTAICKAAYRLLFSWWLDPWHQRKVNQALWEEIQLNLPFLASHGNLLKHKPIRILPFNYAEVCLAYENLVFYFVRGRGELNVSLASKNTPDDTYELSTVLKALGESTEVGQFSARALWKVDELVRPRLKTLNDSFSEHSFPELERKLQVEKRAMRNSAKELEWELNKRLREIQPKRKIQ
jgi:hypothetical protein